MYWKIGKIGISPVFIAVVAFFCIVDSSKYTVLLLLSAGLHEGGHLLAAKICGAKIEGLYLRPFGINMVLGKGRLIGYHEEIFIALAGPIISFFCAAICFVWCMIFGLFDGAAFWIFANALLFFLNILPIDTLDGGRAFRALLLCKSLPDEADKITTAISVITLIPLSLFAMMMALKSGYNFSLVAIAIFLLLRVCLQNSNRLSITT